MGKILLINGSPNEQGCTYTALKEIADTLSQNDVESEILYLGKKPVAGCIDCGKCSQTGRCVFDDKVNEVLERLDEYDGIVVGSPVYYAVLPDSSVHFLTVCFIAVRAVWRENWLHPLFPAAGVGQVQHLIA